MPRAVSVTVPATSANLGPGFDCLGLALNIYLRVSCSAEGRGLRISANEPGIALDQTNLIYRAMAAAVEAARQPEPDGIALRIENAIPLSRGLGSSAAAIAAGLMLGNALAGEPFDKARLLEIGLPLEGHPDNLAPALFGGLRVSSTAGSAGAPGGAGVAVEVGAAATAVAVGPQRVISLPVALGQAPDIVLYVPDFEMSTHEARRVLPDSVPRVDAIFNACRSSLLVAALAGGDFSVLQWAMEDRLHQPYRSAIFPALPRLIQAALDAGAAGAALSGAGSTVIAFCERNSGSVAMAFEAAGRQAGLTGRSLTAEVDLEGARLA